MKMIPRQNWAIKTIDDVLESMEHGQTLTKFVAVDKGSEDGDFTVEIHGLVSEDGTLTIVSEKVTPVGKVRT